MNEIVVSNRRTFLKTLAIAPSATTMMRAAGNFPRTGGTRVRVSCNAYSFNEFLQSGVMTLAEMIDFCAGLQFDGVDLTGYYFKGYPSKPDTAELFEVKRHAFLLGLDISGTGVRNNFTHPDPAVRQADEKLVDEWLTVASRLGAPSLRVFAGRTLQEGISESSAHQWVVSSLRRCAQRARRAGVMLALQNHAAFIKTPQQLIRIIEEVDSDWLGVMLDIGSFRSADPYREIAMAAPYAVSWQIKEEVHFGSQRTRVDLERIRQILHDVAYRGYVLVETLEGDPRKRVPPFLDQVRDKLL